MVRFSQLFIFNPIFLFEMLAKDRHRATLIDYLGNWENPWLKRKQMAEICGIQPESLRNQFSPDDYAEVENEGLELRKKNSAGPRSEIYQAMLKEGKAGVVQAQKEFLERTEGKVTEKIEHSLNTSMLQIILDSLPLDQQEQTKQALLELSEKA